MGARAGARGGLLKARFWAEDLQVRPRTGPEAPGAGVCGSVLMWESYLDKVAALHSSKITTQIRRRKISVVLNDQPKSVEFWQVCLIKK